MLQTNRTVKNQQKFILGGPTLNTLHLWRQLMNRLKKKGLQILNAHGPRSASWLNELLKKKNSQEEIRNKLIVPVGTYYRY